MLSPRIAFSILALLSFQLVALDRARTEETFEMTLTPESTYVSGCFPPCLCPVEIPQVLSGTLTFRVTETNPLFTDYAVEADLLVARDPPASLQGSGTFRFGGEVAITQELNLDLSMNGEPAERFHSGVVIGSSEFPDRLEIMLSVGNQQCFDRVLEIHARRTVPTGARFVRGDCNADAQLDISDAVSGLVFLFGGGPAPTCFDACDANDDGRQDLSDAVTTLSHLFLGGDPLPSPTDACGSDPTKDELGCASYPPCVASCDVEVKAIAKETSLVGSCSAVVRLDYSTRSILGWQLLCGKYTSVTEKSARDQAQTDTGFGAGQMLNVESPADEYVFFESPGDFGGVGVVSARTGLSVFGGGIVWGGRGDITYPKEWRSPDSLGADCKPWTDSVTAKGYDLSGGQELSQGDVEAALDVVRKTAVFEGMATSGYVFDSLVLLYPRSVGVVDPDEAEWIVIVNGGWLE